MSRLPPNKRRRLSPPGPPIHDEHPSDSEAEAVTEDALLESTAQWDLEQDYEQRPRKQKHAKENLRLPIKTAEGFIELVEVPKKEAKEDSGSSFGSLADDTDDTEASKTQVVEEQPKVSQREQIIQTKEKLAKLAGSINEDPEEHIGALRVLAEITISKNSTIKKLGLATQLAVYKDVIPSYRIRPALEEEMAGKLSKDVKKLRNFEQAVVGGYQKYVNELARIAALTNHNPTGDAASLASVAITCACNLLNAVPHFNFRGDLLKILVNKLSYRRVDKDFSACRGSLQTLFAEDEEGNASLEAVAILAKMIKAKEFSIDESVLNLFLHLRLLTEFLHKASNTAVDKKDRDTTINGKRLKQKREFWTKKQRKLAKERKGIEKEFKEADAVVSYEERDQRQSETLKLVFGVYFRILKARTPSLMGAVLEGLVKYAHLINQDFFGDLLESLKDLITEEELPTEGGAGEEQEVADKEEGDDVPRNVTRESLLCVITAFALLQGQDGTTAATTLNLDLSFFISHLYRTLYPAALSADIEFSSKSLHLPDPDSSSTNPPKSKVNVHTTIVLLLRSLHAVLLPTNTRSVPPIRLAAFTKQILTTSLHLPEKSCTAMLGLLNQVVRTHRKKISGLWNTEERRGDGVFDPLRGEVEGSNPFAGTVWEGELLKWHYAPAVREGAKALESVVVHG